MAYTAKDVEKLQQQLGLASTAKTNTTTAKTNTNTNTGTNNVLIKQSGSAAAGGNYTAADVEKLQQQLGLTGTSRTTGSANATVNRPKSSGTGSAQKWTTGTPEDTSAYSKALDSYRENKNSGDPMGDYVTTGSATKKTNLEKYETYNDWLDEDERNGELVRAIEQADKDAARQLAAGGKPTETVQAAADRALQEQGYSRGEIATARNMAAAYEGMGLYDAGHRVANTAGGVLDTVASAIPLAVETGTQAAKNRAARAGLSTNDNYLGTLAAAVEQANQSGGAADLNTMEQLAEQAAAGGRYDERLLDAVERINGSGGVYTYEDLAANSEWDIDEIEAAAAAIADTKKPVSQDGLGYGLYKRGQELTADAQKGLTTGERFLQGAATSAAENLAVSAVNPAMVLPVLSAQGAAESMGAAAESGQEAGTALASGLAKFGLGWAINSVGVTNLAETMGSDYAASSVAADINSWMRSADGLAELAEKAPTIYAMISGGADNAVQAFAETYADAMVDAVIGGEDVSFDSDMFLQAMEAAASGGVSGAMGGGVGAQIGRTRANRAQNAALNESATRNTTEAESPANRPQNAQATVAENATTESAPAAAVSAAQTAQNAALNESATRNTTEAESPAESPKAADSALFEGGRLDSTAWDALRSDRRAEARLLAENTQMSDAAIDTAMDAMPDGVSGEVYSAAANSMYQLARQGIANDYADALALASKAGVMTGQVLATEGGEEALRSIYNQGKIEGLEASGYAQPTLNERAGQVTFEEGTRQRLGEADTALIDLAAKASDTAITVKNHLENDVGGYADTAIGEVFFGVDDMSDTFATLLHEQNHQFNAWDGEGGRLLQTEVLRALAEKDGFESVDRLAQSYIEKYAKAGQEISYAEACEEITGDALRGIFGTEESFERWVDSQIKTYDAGYESKPKILKIFEAVGNLLGKVAKSARQILHLDRTEDGVTPELQAAAKRALALSEERRAQLEELYYSHARQATANERAAYGETEQGQQEKAQKAKEDAERGDDWGWDDEDEADDPGSVAESVSEPAVSASPEKVPARLEGESEEKAEIRLQLGDIYEEVNEDNRRRAGAWYDANRNEIENALEYAFKGVQGNKIDAETADKLAAKLMREVTGTEKDRIRHRSKEDKAAKRGQLAKKLVALGEYMSGEGANYDAAIAAAESIAEDLMYDSEYIDRTLWNEYPDMHKLEFAFAKNSRNYKELLHAYDSWSNAKKELARYNIKLALMPEGTRETFDIGYSELSQLAPGFFPEENATEFGVEIIDMAKRMMEAIRPTYRNQFEEDWDGARADIALRILGEMTAAGAADGKMAAAATERINANLNALREGSKQQMLDALAEQERVAKQLQKTKEEQARAEERLKRTRAAAAEAAENDPRLQAARLQAREADVKKAERSIKSRQAAADVKIQKAMARADAKIAREEQAVRVQKTKNEISRNLTKLNRMLLHPKENAHVPQGMLPAAIKIAELANYSKYNKGMVDQLTALKDQLKGAAEKSDIYTDWKDGQIDEMLNELTETMRGKVADRTNPTEDMADTMDRIDDAALDFTGSEAEALFAKTGTKEGRMIRMTPRELEVLSNAVSAILKATENANKLVGQEYKESADMFADMAIREVNSSAARLDAKGKAGVLKQLGNKYQNSALNAERFFRRLGGYREGGAMDRLGKSLAAAENRKIYIQQKGEEIFRDVTGRENRKNMEAFAGRKAELVDVGLVDRQTGETVKINHAQLVSLYQHLRYEDNRDHVLNGGIRVPDMELMAKGKNEDAQRLSHLAMFRLSDTEAIDRVTDAMTKYDYKWVTALDELHNHYAKDTINEVSRKLHGYERATVDGYYPINVDKGTVEMEIQGLKTDQRLENRGFLKERKHGQNPVNLMECNQVAEMSLKNAAEYGGMAAAIRDANKILNINAASSNSLYEAIRKNYGSGAEKYVTKYIADLQTKSHEDDDILTAALNTARSGYAGAVLTLNPSVAMAQAASLPTAGAVLGGGATMKAAGQLVKNLTSRGNKESERIRQEMMEHGNGLLEYRMRGNLDGEMAAMDKSPTAMDRVPKAFTGWISRMDEVTVEALWEGAKDYVRNHPDEFSEGAKTEGSEEWWAAVSAKQTEIINKTQPNYTVSQQAAIQRGGELSRMLMMFKTQSMQNYGILSDAVGNYRAQAEYLKQGEQQAAAGLEGLKKTAAVNTQRTMRGAVDPDSITNGEAAQKRLDRLRANRDKAGKELQRAVVSQLTQATVFVGMKMLVSDWLLHRFDREQDENGDVTAASVAKRFGKLYRETFTGMFIVAGDIVNMWLDGEDSYGDAVSVAALDAINDTATDLVNAANALADVESYEELYGGAAQLAELLATDTSGMSELEETEWWGSVKSSLGTMTGSGSVLGSIASSLGDLAMLAGIPVDNAVKLIQGATGWAADAYNVAAGHTTPRQIITGTGTSSGQYSRLYTAIFEDPDSEEAEAAREKLRQLDEQNPPGKAENAKAGDSRILTEMMSRVKKYDPDGLLSGAAEARVNGDEETRKASANTLVNMLCEAMGFDPADKRNATRKTAVINRVNSAIQSEVNTMLGRDSNTGATEYDALIAAIDAGKGAAAEQQKLRTAGKDDSTIKSALTSEYKEAYCTADDADRAKLAKSLTALTDSSGEEYYTQDTLDGWVTDYVLQGDNESVWTALDEELERGGETGAQAVLYYIGQGKSTASVKAHITNEYKKRYKAAGEAERLEIQAMLEALRDDNGKKLYKASTIRDWAKE